MPFAIVGREWVHQDQSIPASKRSKILRRDGSKPVVKGIALSTNYSAVDASSKGSIQMFIQGSSMPSVANNFVHEPATNGSLSKRGLFDWVGKSLKGEPNNNRDTIHEG